MGGRGSSFAWPSVRVFFFTPACGSGPWVGAGGGVWEVSVRCGLSTVRVWVRGGDERRWQVEVRAEQFSRVGVEVRRGMGGRLRAGPEHERRGGIRSCQGNNPPPPPPPLAPPSLDPTHSPPRLPCLSRSE